MLESLNKTVALLQNFLNKGEERSKNAKRNIAASFLLKGFSILINILLVPATIHYLNPTKYGIWITISSIFSWFSFFDIGLGNGLRNKLAEAIALDNKLIARTYVSTAYTILSLIIICVYIILLILNYFIDWTIILNTASDLESELSTLAYYLITFVCLKFVLDLINSVINANQKPALASLLNVSSSGISLLAIIILTHFTSQSLIFLGVILSAIPVLVLTFASIYLYRNDYNFYAPSLKFVDFKQTKTLANLGFQFFVIQIAVLVIFSTDNFIITHLYGPAEVAPYNIAFRYFSVVLMIFNIVLSPFWSAYTEAYYKHDYEWIKNITNKLIRLWIAFVIIVILMLLVSNYVYNIWTGNTIKVPFLLSAFMALFVIITTFSNIFVNVINGVGKVRIQLYLSVFAGIVNIPLSIFFAKTLNLGTAGIILATCTSLFLSAIAAPIQYNKLINKKAYGLWAK